MAITQTGSPSEAQVRHRIASARDARHEEITSPHKLNRLLIRAVKALGDAGQTDLACRIAAEAWAALRKKHPEEAEKLNGALHYLTRPRP